MHVIGTAGHVDHGKSTLVTALTGINPDRLKEERDREMTIDLGFAWLRLPNGEEVGVVDVPGHRDFIENMLAGMGGIDLVLLVIAADESIMPQTQEHLAIIDLLGIHTGIIVLTKTDLVADEEWLTLVESDIRKSVAGTTLEQAPILHVSARQATGVQELILAIQASLQSVPPREDKGRPRLPIDRVFSLTGFGTVVTGTLLDGILRVGDEIEILPGELHGRIRGLQTHKQKEEQAVPGSRTAINISGIEVAQVRRGQVLTHVRDYVVTQRLDVSFRLLADQKVSINHQDAIKLFIGAAEVNARARVLGREELQPGEQGYLQVELEMPCVAVKGDRFILRRPSPPATLGGGMVLDPAPARRHRRLAQNVIKGLSLLENGAPADALLQTSQKAGILSVKELRQKSQMTAGEFERLLKELLASGQAVLLGKGDPIANTNLLVGAANTLTEMQTRTKKVLADFHSSNPMRPGIKKEELSTRIGLAPKMAETVFQHFFESGWLQDVNGLIGLPGIEVKFSAEKQKAVERLLKEFADKPYAPPSVEECVALSGKEVYQALVERGDLVQISAEVVFRHSDLQAMMAEIEAMIAKNGSVTLAEVRDRYQTSRRYALAVLEAMDRQGITTREGDLRKLRKK